MSSNARYHRRPFDPIQYGFEFSLAEMAAFDAAAIAFREVTGVSLDFPNWLAHHRAAQKEATTR